MTDVHEDRLNLFDRTGFKLPYKKIFQTWFHPETLDAAAARFLPEDAEVLAVEVPEGARAYPVRTIQSHHIIQDRIGGREVLVTF
jgi:hypothetical protein